MGVLCCVCVFVYSIGYDDDGYYDDDLFIYNEYLLSQLVTRGPMISVPGKPQTAM